MTRKITIDKTLDAGNDVLIVRGYVEGVTATNKEGKQVALLIEARGWLSAMTNHYDADQYGVVHEGAHLKDGATPREMTAGEKLAYCENLLDAAAPKPEREPQPIALF